MGEDPPADGRYVRRSMTVPNDLSSLCGGCHAAMNEPHRPGCAKARCPYCGGQRYDCHEPPGCEVFGGVIDDKPSMWWGRWPQDIAAERYGVDKREIFDLIEVGLFVWDPDTQLFKPAD
ncbi:hypothetical protein F5972_08315 [Microbispora cellulosiformans]|uniref:Uncharacterized protein n=1 Tax=Microbispora cellulosiformans TaxID=2614688 RepID=A0A5J5K5S9_9ACTN|nr:hypothetical protein [Microbispora cellulosiformans]KAA9379647.1 hypothetical protein F5972_08315 [Microbispora cellulosiformans]